MNALILGTDNNTDWGNTDVLIVAQLSADRTRVTLVGIPRDSYVTLSSGRKNKINAALMEGGISETRDTVSALFGGLPIHFMAQTNFTHFIKLATLMSGFGVVNKIASSVTSTITGKVTYFPAGKLVKWGADWLIYARQRHDLPMGEFDRGERHRAIVTGMTKLLQYLSWKEPARLVNIANGTFNYVNYYGGITKANILGLVPALQKIQSFTSLRVPAAFADPVTVDYGQLGDLARALRNGNIQPYLDEYGISGK